MIAGVPYWRLSAFYFFYYTCLGAWIPFWPLYLQYLGHSAVVIGVTSAVFHATRVVAPNIWGYLADRTQQRLLIIRLGCFFAFFFILGMLLGSEVWWLTLVLALFSFFWSAVLPQFEVLTLSFLGRKSHDYGRIRLWGGWGYIAAVVAIGWLFERFSLGYFPLLIAVSLFFLWLSTVMVPRPPETSFSGRQLSFSSLFFQPRVLAFLLCVLLVQISFGPYYAFFSIHLRELGYSALHIGLIWSLGVMAEVFLMFWARHLLNWFGLYRLLLVTLALTVLRWGLLWQLGDQLQWILIVQLLHAFSFGAFHACVIEQVRRYFGGRNHGRGQALFNSIGYGLGAVSGAIMAGLLWIPMGQNLFAIGSLLCLAALVLVILVPQGGSSEDQPVSAASR